ncbi:MAG TPA: PP2C family protein-serine/threonine phosphatase [Pyrinomonadaceae bacterium]
MSQSLNSRLATQTALDVRAYAPRRAQRKPRRQDLELKLAELQRDYAELHTSIFEAAQVHRRLCAPRHVRFGEFEIASEIFAVRQLPGDFFSVEYTDSGVVLALGDVAGKGLAAGMWTPHLVGLVRAHTTPNSTPESIVAGVNRDISRTPAIVPFASLFLAKLDSATGVLEYCSAGHPPAFLLRADGEMERLTDGGLLLGALAEAEYISASCTLGAGDTLMIYSDGITESRNSASEEFGYARLERQLRLSQRGSADSILFSVLGAVQDFAATRPLIDDMSLAIIRRDDA